MPFPHVDTPEGLVEARASLERLVALNATHVLPCHGGTIDPAVLERNIAWIDAVSANPALPYEEALERFGDGREDVLEMYRSFHADACWSCGPGARLTRPGASGMID